MMVDGTRGEVLEFRAGTRLMSGARGILETQHRVRVGHIELIYDQRHAEGRMQILQKREPLVGDCPTVAVPAWRAAE